MGMEIIIRYYVILLSWSMF